MKTKKELEKKTKELFQKSHDAWNDGDLTQARLFADLAKVYKNHSKKKQ